jgi:hypothetical protein
VSYCTQATTQLYFFRKQESIEKKLQNGGVFMVKIYGKDGKEEKFDSKDVERDLKAAGLPERVAEEVAERVEDRVQDGWTVEQVRQETDVELRRLQEDIDRAHASYKSATPMGPYSVGEQRVSRESDYSPRATPRSESKVELRNVEE